VLYYSRRMQEIISESQTGQYPERFPHLVSFVGQTGACFFFLFPSISDD
jgi:hypothetical protein